jgi:hypothetical protein
MLCTAALCEASVYKRAAVQQHGFDAIACHVHCQMWYLQYKSTLPAHALQRRLMVDFAPVPMGVLNSEPTLAINLRTH